MSFEDFLAEFKKRHAKDYGLSGGSVAVKAPMGKEAVTAPVLPVSARLDAVPDRMSQSAGDDWDALEYTEEPEVVE